MNRRKLFLANMPIVVAMLTGWIMYLVQYGMMEHVYEKTEEDPLETKFHHIIFTIPSWLYIIAVPVAAILTGIYTITLNSGLAVTLRVVVFGCGIFLGGCLPASVYGLKYHITLVGEDLLAYHVVGFAGLMTSLFSMAAIIGLMPIFVQRLHHHSSYQLVQGGTYY